MSSSLRGARGFGFLAGGSLDLAAAEVRWRRDPMKRVLLAVLLVLAPALLAGASVSWSPAVTLQITSSTGEPAPRAYVRYHYDTSILNFVDSLDRVSRGSAIVRADADGTATIPWRLHLRAPWPITTPPEVFVDHVYVPGLHNASGPIPLRYGPHQAPLFQVDDGGRVTLVDASRDPALWERSLHELYDCIREATEGRERMADPRDGSADRVRELIRHFRQEYAALLAAEPLSGPRLERFWSSRLKRLEQLERGLPPYVPGGPAVPM